MSGTPERTVTAADRSRWYQLSDDRLLSQCGIDTYRASGPGGQKRNKTSSAVRLRHEPSGLIVIAEESRSQHENKAKALRRLRQAFMLEIRSAVSNASQLPEIVAAKAAGGRLDVGVKDVRFWPAVGVVLDVLASVDARVADAAAALGISTGNLIDFLEQQPKVWQHANGLRSRFGQKPLR